MYITGSESFKNASGTLVVMFAMCLHCRGLQWYLRLNNSDTKKMISTPYPMMYPIFCLLSELSTIPLSCCHVFSPPNFFYIFVLVFQCLLGFVQHIQLYFLIIEHVQNGTSCNWMIQSVSIAQLVMKTKRFLLYFIISFLAIFHF